VWCGIPNTGTWAQTRQVSRRERGISVDEAEELPRNNHVTLRNRGRARRSARKLRDRRLLTGKTNGGRTLTLVIERTKDSTTWVIVTGWTATGAERRRIED
jgi:hypothetical protein